MTKYQFPWGIYIGDFINENSEINNQVPALLPSGQGGFRLGYDESSEAMANTLLENITLSLARVLPPQAVEFHVFDFGHKKRFPYLAMLREQKLYHIALNGEEAEKHFATLENISRHRHHELLTPVKPTISDYNKNSTYPEPFHLLLIHLSHYPNDMTGYLRLKSFFDDAAAAGFYTILFGEPPQEENRSNNRQKSLAYLEEKFPVITMKNKEFHFKKKQFSLAELTTWYDFIPADCNREGIINEIVTELQKNDPVAGESDFLSLPIAVTRDGRENIFFSLGDRSKNYHAFITGQTGSGKTVLLNNLIVGIAQKYTAQEVQLYLMDYKHGVEFTVFKNHPNCEKLFLDENDFSLAVQMIREFADIMGQRSQLLRNGNFRNIAQYNEAFPATPLPYKILIIDEAHRLFSGSYRQQDFFIKQLDAILREGRSYGLHIIFSTQTLAGSGIDKNLMGQIQLRLSFKLGRSVDCDAIMDMHNDAPLHLDDTRHELVVNTASGNRDGNTICRANPPLNIEEELVRIRASRSASQMIQPQIYEGEREETVSAEKMEKKERAKPMDWLSDGKAVYSNADDEALLKKLQQQLPTQNGEEV